MHYRLIIYLRSDFSHVLFAPSPEINVKTAKNILTNVVTQKSAEDFNTLISSLSSLRLISTTTNIAHVLTCHIPTHFKQPPYYSKQLSLTPSPLCFMFSGKYEILDVFVQ